MWMGRSPEGGQVRLTKMEDISKVSHTESGPRISRSQVVCYSHVKPRLGQLVLQLPAMLVGLQFVNVNVNNLYAWPEHVKKAPAKARGTIKACAIAPL